jgi:hypothetical protein
MTTPNNFEFHLIKSIFYCQFITHCLKQPQDCSLQTFNTT